MAQGSLVDPIPSYKYGLEIDGVLVAGFTSCSGLEVSREAKEVVEGGVNDHVHVLPGPLEHGQVALKQGISYTNYLWEWFQWGMYDTAVKRKPVTIFSYDVGGVAVNTWSIVDAYPVKLVGQDLSADGREAGLETVEIAFGGRRGQGSAGGQAQRLEAADGDAAGAGGAGGAGSGAPGKGGLSAGGPEQRELASKVLKLMKDTLREERERAGKVSGY